jgi:hypothetical protein
MAARSNEARRIRRELQRQLDAVSRATGQPMQWTPEETAVIDMICDCYDRKRS